VVDEKKVILVEVPEGEDKPYQSKRDKNWYVRHNSNDMMMERSEMFQLLQKSAQREFP
jgi:predicted HTH transcriptional regulator